MGIPLDALSFELAEMKAVQAALADFAQFQLALDIGEEAVEMQPSGFAQQAAETMGTPDAVKQLEELVVRARSEFDQYLYEEQSALVEGIVRAYARRRLRALLEQYEVLEVEREGSWLLWQQGDMSDRIEGWFMSRPDALLLERESKQLYILSFKTAAEWDRRKAEDAKRDMQGLSEGVEVEKRLGEWWGALRVGDYMGTSSATWEKLTGITPAMRTYLISLPAPPRILGIRYEYLLKGKRLTDKQLSEQLGVAVRTQRSPLVSAYKNQGMAAGDEQWNVSWDYIKETGETSKLYWKNWKSTPVFKEVATKDWVDRLDQTVMAAGEEGREAGWSSKGQATGFLEEHPLDALFIPPIVVYRNDDELRDWIEQVESQERRVAEAVVEVHGTTDEGEKRHLLNIHFPMSRRACEYPTTCQMVKLCYGGEDIRRDPLGSGVFKRREPHHQPEKANNESLGTQAKAD